ncbi:MAG: RES family NAD+ phosphorylase [Chthoniobacterales bacterium]
MLTPHPDFSRYFENLSRSDLSPWRGVLFRSAAIAHASAEDLISGHGAELAGGRWNPPGLRTVYGSLNPGLSVDESLEAVLRGYGFNSEDLHPRVIAAIEVELEAVLILDPAQAIPEWLDYDQMLKVDWRAENGDGRETASQALGRAVASAGEALVTESRGADRNEHRPVSRAAPARQQHAHYSWRRTPWLAGLLAILLGQCKVGSYEDHRSRAHH